MAKKELPKDTTTAQPAAVATSGPQTLAEAPAWLDSGSEGTEHITKDDMQMPRFAIAQKSSPQVDPDSSQYIEGLEIGQFFNTLTGKIYGDGDMEQEFMVLRADPPRYIEFAPREEGGGVRDMNVPANDPRTQFTTDDKGKPVKPIATKFYDFVVMLLPSKEVVAMSWKSTAIKAAKELNGLIMDRRKPIYTGRYVITNVRKENAKGVFYVPVIRSAGTMSDPARGWAPDPETQALAKKIHLQLQGKTLDIDREGVHDDEGDTDFPHGANAAAPGDTRGM